MIVRHVVVAAVLALGTAAAVSACSTATSPDAATDVSVDAASIGTNPFIPEDANIGDCLSSLPPPGCGTEASTSGKTLATFGVLMLGMAFIGWRVARGVRQRDASRSSS